MSGHYLVDLFHAPLMSSRIIDVRNPPNGQSLINGCFIVRVGDGTPVDKPTDLSDLLTKKLQGLLAFYAGFTQIVADPIIDASNIDLINSSFVMVGDRSSVSLLGGSSSLRSVAIPLGSTPSQVVATWELFSVSDADDKNDRFQRTYVEEDPDTVTCSVSTNGGANFSTTTDGAVLNVPVPFQGNSLIIEFLGPPGRRYLGAWALIY